MMNDEITELIEEYGITNGPVSYHMAKEFYRAAYNNGVSDAAKVTELIGPQDGSLKLVTAGFADAIRALEMK